MIRLTVLSDIHLDSAWLEIQESDIRPDVVALIGDIHDGTAGIEWAAQTWRNASILYVPGNHEFAGAVMQDRRYEIQRAAMRHKNVHLLDRQGITIDGVRFMGATLWTDLNFYGEYPTPFTPLTPDFTGRIQWRDGSQHNSFELFRSCFDRTQQVTHEAASRNFSLADCARLFNMDRRFLEKELSDPLPYRKKVVLTHHLPSAKSIAPDFANAPSNVVFASHLDELVQQSTIWCHGHTHHSCRYFHEKTEVICNPRGYAKPNCGDQNPHFDKHFLIEI